MKSDQHRISWRKTMRDMSHRAAAALTLGLLTDDLFGALLDAPSGASPERTDQHDKVADYVAASRWLRDEELRRSRAHRPAALRLN
jgi:hypothetical protein